MKKILFLTTTLAFSAIGIAQLRYGVEATGSMASAFVKSRYDIDFDKEMKPAPGAGAFVQLDLGKRFSLRTGLSYLQEGVTFNYSLDEFSSTTIKTRLNYAQLPVSAIFRFPVAGNHVFMGAGGYGAYGFSGNVTGILRYKMTDGETAITEERQPAFEKSEDDGGNLERMDYGVTGLAGIQLRNGLFIQARYQHGISNIERDKQDKYRNRGIQVSVGKMF